MLILRPLLGMDKHEIVARAEEIDIYEISIRPMRTAAPFSQHSPATRPKMNKVAEAEAALDINNLTEAALNTMETIQIER